MNTFSIILLGLLIMSSDVAASEYPDRVNSHKQDTLNINEVDMEDSPLVIKVVVVYQNPKIRKEGGKRFHEIHGFNDPIELNRIYKDSMEAVSHNTIKYEIVKVIDEDRMWTRFEDSTEYLTKERTNDLLSEPNFETLKERNPRFDYEGFINYYGFGKLRDVDKVNEVWVWSWPVSGMWESQQAGQNAMWCNSDPLFMDNKKTLTVMGFNYERTADLAMHSFGHRAESILKIVYEKWEPLKNVEVPNNWELFTSLDKDTPKKGHVGNCHFPVNGQADYDYSNKRETPSYAYIWKNYPNLDWENSKPEIINCEDWQCNQMGYMSWWYRKFPHLKGLNSKDKKLNNWWYYVVNYEYAMQLETSLNERTNTN